MASIGKFNFTARDFISEGIYALQIAKSEFDVVVKAREISGYIKALKLFEDYSEFSVKDEEDRFNRELDRKMASIRESNDNLLEDFVSLIQNTKRIDPSLVNPEVREGIISDRIKKFDKAILGETAANYAAVAIRQCYDAGEPR